ncbi:membrane protein [Gammaproteobacteria bacterium]|nr:membrane protein [Gammaproteobacteria bacterium]
MHYVGLIIHIILIVIVGLSVIRNNNERYWIFIALMFPVIGALVYFLVNGLSSATVSRKSHNFLKVIENIAQPHKSLKDAELDFERAKTANNEISLADALLKEGLFTQALEHYHNVLNGFNKNEPNIMLKLAAAYFANKSFAQSRQTLDDLRLHNPDFNSQEGHLLYAKNLAELQDTAAAKNEFEALINYYLGYSAKVSYAQYLIKFGDKARAHEILTQLLAEAKIADQFVIEINKAALSTAKSLLKTLD